MAHCTYIVRSLLILITLLVLRSLGLVWCTLLVVECLPALSKLLANLTCEFVSARSMSGRKIAHTEGDSWVLFADVLVVVSVHRRRSLSGSGLPRVAR